MGTRALPEMYSLSPWACGPQASGIHIYQAKHSCPCYNYNVASKWLTALVL